MHAKSVEIKFTIAARSVLKFRRNLLVVSKQLDELLDGSAMSLPVLAEDADGYRMISIPENQMGGLQSRIDEFCVGSPSNYPRYYIDMSIGFDAYMQKFSGKTRSTLNRKTRKYCEKYGGELDVREFSTPDEIAQFIQQARDLSAKTYQERLLGSGLPGTPEDIAEARKLAAEDNVRAYLLYADEQPVSYLYLPVRNNVVVYAYLGYHPDYSKDSVGTVLQMEALKRLFAEKRFAWFDFTSGDGAHKKLFGTDKIDCTDFIALRPTLPNKALLFALSRFDTTINKLRGFAEKNGLKSKLRGLIRA